MLTQRVLLSPRRLRHLPLPPLAEPCQLKSASTATAQSFRVPPTLLPLEPFYQTYSSEERPKLRRNASIVPRQRPHAPASKPSAAVYCHYGLVHLALQPPGERKQHPYDHLQMPYEGAMIHSHRRLRQKRLDLGGTESSIYRPPEQPGAAQAPIVWHRDLPSIQILCHLYDYLQLLIWPCYPAMDWNRLPVGMLRSNSTLFVVTAVPLTHGFHIPRQISYH